MKVVYKALGVETEIRVKNFHIPSTGCDLILSWSDYQIIDHKALNLEPLDVPQYQ